MSYNVYLYSVTPSSLQAFQEGKATLLNFSNLSVCSNMIRLWNPVLAEAIVGGELVHPNLTHPFRSPTFHSVDAAAELQLKLVKEWEAIVQDRDFSDDWSQEEIRKVVELFTWARTHREAVISSLGALHSDRPHDSVFGNKKP